MEKVHQIGLNKIIGIDSIGIISEVMIDSAEGKQYLFFYEGGIIGKVVRNLGKYSLKKYEQKGLGFQEICDTEIPKESELFKKIKRLEDEGAFK